MAVTGVVYDGSRFVVAPGGREMRVDNVVVEGATEVSIGHTDRGEVGITIEGAEFAGARDGFDGRTARFVGNGGSDMSFGGML